jgi:hypothetical protein
VSSPPCFNEVEARAPRMVGVNRTRLPMRLFRRIGCTVIVEY